jgi:tight adherence protein B
MSLFVPILLALAVVLLVLGIGIQRGGAVARELGERLRRMAPQSEGPGPELERDRRLSVIPWLDRVLRNIRLGERLEMLLYQAGVGLRAGTLILLCVVFAIGGYVLGISLFHRIFTAFVGLAVCAPLPLLYVLSRKQQRMRAFAREFPDALDLLVTALRAGLSFTAAMQIVADEAPEPVRGEFAVTVEEQSLGLDPREALLNLTRRVDVLDLRFFATAVLLQRETGGNLAEVLENTSALIRDRFRVLGDIQTYTAQGKITGMILVCLPIFICVFMLVLTPDFFRPMLDSDAGRFALWLAAGMQLAGILAVRKIVNIRV